MSAPFEPPESASSPDSRGPFDPRPLLVLLTVPLISLGHSAAYYAARAGVFQLWLNQTALGQDEIYETYHAVTTWGPLAGFVLALLLGLTAGGWAPTVLGLVLMSVGVALTPVLAVDDATLLGLPLALATAGRTAASLGLFVVLADALRGRRAWLLLAGGAAMLACISLGALGSSSLVNQLTLSGSPDLLPWVYAGSTAVAALDVGLVVLIGGAWLLLGRRRPEPDARRRRVLAGPTVAGLVIALLGGLTLVASYSGLDLGVYQRASLAAVSPGQYDTLQYVSVGTTVGVGALLSLAGVGLHVLRVPTRVGPPLGAAVVALLVALGVLLPLVLPVDLGGLGVGVGVSSLAEGLCSQAWCCWSSPASPVGSGRPCLPARHQLVTDLGRRLRFLLGTVELTAQGDRQGDGGQHEAQEQKPDDHHAAGDAAGGRRGLGAGVGVAHGTSGVLLPWSAGVPISGAWGLSAAWDGPAVPALARADAWSSEAAQRKPKWW